VNPLISPDDHATLWALIAAGTALAIWLEQTYRWAARLSGPVIALLIAMLLSNTRIVPTDAPAYDFVGAWLVPIAIPLLLFRANLREIARTGWKLLVAFHLAAIGTLIGTILAVWLLHGRLGATDSAHAAGLMAASYIGGGVNMLAVKASYNVPPNLFNPLVVADNFVMAGFFIIILSIGASRWFRAHYPHPHTLEASTAEAENLAAKHWQRKGIGLLDIARSLAFAFAVVAIATGLGRAAKGVLGDGTHASMKMQMLTILCTNRFVLLTGVSLLFATVFARWLVKINGPEELGAYLLMLFLFTLGLPADLVTVLQQAPILFIFCAIIATMNVAFTLAAGKLLRLNLEELLLAMNATLGGPPTAAAMAISAGWPKLVLPGLLIGLWGYVIGTPVGVMVVEFFRR
jgi:uncharacterized membrane protein